MNFFKPEDFDLCKKDQKCISALANQKLEKEGVVVYGQTKDHYWSRTNNYEDTHKALLINIVSQKKCEHPKEKVMHTSGEAIKFICDCGATVYPNSYSEEK